MSVKEFLRGVTKDNACALVVQEGCGYAFEDPDVMTESFENDGCEEAAEGTADLEVGAN